MTSLGTRGLHEPVHQEELARPGHRGGGPRDDLVAELLQEHERKHRERRAKKTKYQASSIGGEMRLGLAMSKCLKCQATFQGDDA